MEMNPFRSLFLSLSRMPPILMLFIILGLAVVVTMYVMGIVNSSQEDARRAQQAAEQAKQGVKSKVVYASKNIEEGEIIPAEALEEKDVDQNKAPIDAFTSANAVVGQQAAYPIPAGQIVSQHSVKQMAIQTGFEGKIKEGMRALTFGVDTNSGVAGFIAPGSHVDVVCITGSAGDTKAAPVMSDVEVIAVGTTYQKAPGQATANPAGSVTVAVTPEDAIKLIKAISAAKPYLVLRNDKDHSPVAVVDVKDLFPKPKKEPTTEVASLPAPNLPPPPLPSAPSGAPDASALPAVNAPPPPPPMHEIEMWSGSKKEVLSVPQG
jgi:pilus assembly protein CpaB